MKKYRVKLKSTKTTEYDFWEPETYRAINLKIGTKFTAFIASREYVGFRRKTDSSILVRDYEKI